MTQNAPEEEFRLIKGKKKCRRGVATIINPDQSENEKETHEIDSKAIISRLDKLQVELKSSKYYVNSLDTLHLALKEVEIDKVEKLVCFGIGSFATCQAAQQQLAFILQIRESLQIPVAIFYDPILKDYERAILQSLKCELLPENCEGKYPVECITLFYLPHCPKQLTNNILWTNWGSELLSKAILICNSFETLIRNTPERFLLKDAGYVIKLDDSWKEFPLENCYKYQDVFNDTSVHVFPPTNLARLEKGAWEKLEEPTYCDIELITKQIKENLTIL